MKGKKKIAWILSLILMSTFLGAAIWRTVETAMDTDQVVVYKNESAENFLILIYSNAAAAKSRYKDQYYVMYGQVRSKGTDNKKMKLATATGHSKETLNCSATTQEAMQSLARVRTGDEVKVYGKLTQGLLDGKWSLSIDKIEKASQKDVSRTTYSVISGKTVDTENMVMKSLNQDKIHYYVPKDWTKVEKNVIDGGLGTMEGYQYRLNEISQQSVQPESIFICYFDSDKLLLKSSDKSQTELIEKAIVKNILKDDPGKPDKKKTTPYGAEYHYYQEVYKTALGQNYHAEFIFQPCGNDGFLVYLYVYREKSHLEDVMIMLRTVEQ